MALDTTNPTAAPQPQDTSTPQQQADQTQQYVAGNAPAPAGPAPSPDTQGMNMVPAAAPADMAAAQPQASDVQKPWHRSVLRSIAEQMSGGPNRHVMINPDGTRVVTETPKSGKQIGLGILAAAVEGALAGMDRRGEKYATGAGAAARGGEAVLAQKQREQQMQDQQAQAQFARQAQVTETNLRNAHTMRMVALQDQELMKPLVDTASPLIQNLRDVHGIQAEYVPEEDLLSKYHITKDQALPQAITPVYNPDGTPAHNPDGSMKYAYQYAVIDPSVDVSIPKEYLDMARKFGIPGWDKPLPGNAIVKARMVSDLYSKVAAIQALDATVSNIHKEQTKDPNTGSIWTLWTNQDGSPDFDALARNGIAVHEGFGKEGARPTRDNNPGDLRYHDLATAMAHGATGIDKDGFAVFPTLDSGWKALKQKLMQDYQKNPTVSPVDYINRNYSPDDAPGNGPGQAQAYASDLIKLSGKTPGAVPPATSSAAGAPERFDVLSAMAGPEGPANQRALQAALPFLSEHPDRPDLALAEMRKKLPPDTTGRVARILTNNGQFDLDKWGQQQDAQKKLAQEQVQAQIEIDKQKALRDDQQARDAEANALLSAYINQPADSTKIPKNIMQMNPDDAEQSLRAAGVTNIPPQFATLMAVANGDADLSTAFSAKTYKGKGPMEMNAQTAEAFIRKYLNPTWNQATFKEKSKFLQDIPNTQSGHAGFVIEQAGAVAQHLEALRDAVSYIDNGQIPLANKLLNSIGYNFGTDKRVIMDNILQRVNSETEKLVTGSTPREEELKQARNNVNDSQSPNQLRQFIDSSIELAQGRLNEVNEMSRNLLHQDIKASPQAALVFGKLFNGNYVPGWGYSVIINGQLRGFRQNPNKVDPNDWTPAPSVPHAPLPNPTQ